MANVTKEVHDINFTIEGIDFKAAVEFEMTYDSNWGADADGNRGVSRWDVTDANVVDIYNITDKKYVSEKDLTHLQSKALESAIEEFDNFNEGRTFSVSILKKLDEATRILKEEETIFSRNTPMTMRPFTKNDWIGFSGATRFRNGAEPMIGEINNIDGDSALGAVVIWDNEIIELAFQDDKDRPESLGDKVTNYEYKDYEDAMRVIKALKDGITIAELEQLGFTHIN